MEGTSIGVIRVLHVITGLDTGGAEVMLLKLVERSDRSRFSHRVVSMARPGAIGRQIDDTGVPVSTLEMDSGVPDPRGFARLMAITRRVAPDVIQTWLYHADLAGLAAGRAFRTPVVWNLRSSSPLTDLSKKTAMVVRACARLSRLPEVVVANSEAARTAHEGFGYRPRVWEIIPNGFDTDRFHPSRAARASVRQELGIELEATVIGLVARFDPIKDHHVFLTAAGMMRAAANMHFLLVGSGVTAENGQLRVAIEEARLRDRVHLVGERQDIPRLTAALDVATNSSYGESFPNVIGEAMACEVPCVVTDVGDSARIVGETGRVVPPRDPLALASAWQELIDLGETGRQELGRKARERVESLYSLDSVVRQYEALYERLARSR